MIVGGHLVPDIIIAGAPKCGTTSVFGWLSQHPEVMPSSEKETYFLVDDDSPLFKKSASIYRQGLGGYRQYFLDSSEADKRRLLEATPDYLYQERTAGIVANWQPAPRVIFLLREPSARVLSAFRFFQNHKGAIPSGLTFETFVDTLLEGKRCGVGRLAPVVDSIIDQSGYIEYLRRWEQLFRTGSARIFLFEKMKEEPEYFKKEVLGFCGLEPTRILGVDLPRDNESYGVRSQFLHRLRRGLSGAIPRGSYRRWTSYFYRKLNRIDLKGADRNQHSPSLLKLREYFAPVNEDLEREYGVSLESWRR